MRLILVISLLSWGALGARGRTAPSFQITRTDAYGPYVLEVTCLPAIEGRGKAYSCLLRETRDGQPIHSKMVDFDSFQRSFERFFLASQAGQWDEDVSGNLVAWNIVNDQGVRRAGNFTRRRYPGAGDRALTSSLIQLESRISDLLTPDR